MAGRPSASSGRPEQPWYSIRNQAAGAPTVVSIVDEVGAFGVSAQDFVRDLAMITGDVELHLSSPGGDVFDGLAIFSALKQRAGTVSVIVDSLAASIASVIAMSATPGQLTITPHASIMIHEASGYCAGTQRDMAATSVLLGQMSDNIASVYADRTGKPVDHWRAAMLAETWYIGQAAVDAGLADRVASVPRRVNNAFVWGRGEADAFRAAMRAGGT